MTNIHFIFNVKNKKNLALRLIKDLFKKEHAILVSCANKSFLADLSKDLWSDDISFIPNSEGDVSIFDKICLTTKEANLMDDVLINCSSNHIDDFSRYLKLYELISPDDNDKQNGRKRYQYYKDCGFRLNAIDESKLII